MSDADYKLQQVSGDQNPGVHDAIEKGARLIHQGMNESQSVNQYKQRQSDRAIHLADRQQRIDQIQQIQDDKELYSQLYAAAEQRRSHLETAPIDLDESISSELVSRGMTEDQISKIMENSPEFERLGELQGQEKAKQYLDVVVNDAAYQEFLDQNPQIMKNYENSQARENEL